MQIELKVCNGSNIKELLNELANLRITVFKEYPYLYDGSLPYEQKYLQTYTNHPEALLIAAIADGRVVGASTAIPLQAETEDVQKPFALNNYPREKIFYFGESVLLKPYRGLGIGKKFMAQRLEFAMLKGFKYATFCAVERPAFHPLKPEAYRNLDKFWESQGFKKQPHLQTHMTWKDIDKAAEDDKLMTFWLREL